MAVYRSGDPDVFVKTNGANETAGDVVVVGLKVCICLNTVTSGGEQTYQFRGRANSVATQSNATWTAGDVVYWDKTNAIFTKSTGDNTFRAGFAAADKASSTATGDVILVPQQSST